jgi:hypothetical protein
MREADGGPQPVAKGGSFSRRVAQAIRERLHLSMLPFLARETANQNRRLHRIEDRLHRVQEALGRLETSQPPGDAGAPLHGCEARVFSQWGEDGIIQHLLRHVAIPRPIFVEFGVEDYLESNTRFLLLTNNWSGLVMDCSAACVERIRSSSIYWRYNLKAVEAFVTRDNINGLIRGEGLSGDIGLLSIDVDGMDYWIWEALDAVSPAIVVAEYNHRFGPHRAVTVPYDDHFDRRAADPSLVYYGASLAALRGLGQRKGYALVGCESHGLNAFFVRRDLLPAGMTELSAAAAFVPGQFKEAHAPDGSRIDTGPDAEAAMLEGLPLVEVDGG